MKQAPAGQFEDMAIFQFGWSLDGKELLYNRGAIVRDIALLRNLKLTGAASMIPFFFWLISRYNNALVRFRAR